MNIEKSLRSGLPVLVLSLLIGGQFEVYMMNVDGSDVMRLTFSTPPNTAVNPVWTPVPEVDERERYERSATALLD
jgi:hypothetical protein